MNHGKSAMHWLATGSLLIQLTLRRAIGVELAGDSRQKPADQVVRVRVSGLKALISTLLWLSSATINRKGNFQSCKCV